jgi:zinc transporter
MDENNGLVFGYILNNGSGKALNWDQVSAWTPSQGTLWLHLDYAVDKVRQWLSTESNIDPASCEALLAEETRPRVLPYDDALLLILRGVNCNPGADPEDMVSIRMWFEDHRIITMRHRKVMAIDDIHQSIETGKGPKSANDFLTGVTRRLTDRMGDVISDIDDCVDELEDCVLTTESHALRPKLANLRRQTISLRRYISPQRDVLSRLLHEQVSWLTEVDRVHLREVAERTSRFVDDIDSARDRAAITQEELNSRLSEQMNRTMYILSVVAGIFLPLGLLTGLLGINVGGMPGTESRFAFTYVSISLIVIAFIQYLLFKRKKIL